MTTGLENAGPPPAKDDPGAWVAGAREDKKEKRPDSRLKSAAWKQLFQETRDADAALLRKAPELAAYIGRIGAVQLSLRSFVVEDQEAPPYGHTRASLAEIRITGTELKCSNKAYEPTEAEAKAIVAELKAADWPRSIHASRPMVDELRRKLGCSADDLCEFQAATGPDILFVQQRIYPENGGKHDLPWSFWNDGVWRQMEPDGLLPLYNLPVTASGWRHLMIHEGAMGAKRLEAAALADHPWGGDIKDYRHLGWPGGAYSAHRVDWEPIRRLPHDVEIVLVCDHDQPGEIAATTISRILKRPIKVLKFDNNFPAKFDLADKFPDHEDWWNGKRYIGPPIEHFISSATWATGVISTGEKGRPSYYARNEFAKEWFFVTQPAVFININFPHRLLSENSFNRAVRPFSDADDTGRLLARINSSQMDGVTYLPSKTSGVVTLDEGRMFNTYTPSPIEALEGDAGPFLEFMEHLIPEEKDRHEAQRWIATLIDRPEIKMHYGMLLISETQGVGKSTLGEKILLPIIGPRNASVPDERTICHSAFNSWAGHKRLAVVHEIYAGESRAAYDKLKSLITDKTVTIERKYMDGYETENWIHVLACSNSKRALYLDPEDRRWLLPRVTEKKQPTEYWRKLNEWLTKDDGLRIIKWWAGEFLKENAPVFPGQDAPKSIAKDEVIVLFRTPGVKLAFEFVELVNDHIERHPEDAAMTFILDDIYEWIKGQLGPSPKMESTNTIRKALRDAGLYDVKRPDPREQRFKVKSFKRYVMATVKIGPLTTWDEVTAVAKFKQPKDVVPL
jgi:hypothetical protein